MRQHQQWSIWFYLQLEEFIKSMIVWWYNFSPFQTKKHKGNFGSRRHFWSTFIFYHHSQFMAFFHLFFHIRTLFWIALKIYNNIWFKTTHIQVFFCVIIHDERNKCNREYKMYIYIIVFRTKLSSASNWMVEWFRGFLL